MTDITDKPPEDHFTFCDINGKIINFHDNTVISLQSLIDYINNSSPHNLRFCSMCKKNINIIYILQQIEDEQLRCELETKIKEKLTPYSFVNMSKEDEICIKGNCMSCPNNECKKPIEKDGGCNTVNCRECNTRFCFECGIEIISSHTCNQDLVDLVKIRKLEYSSLNNSLNDDIMKKIEKEEKELREKIQNDEDKNRFQNLYPNSIIEIRHSYGYFNYGYEGLKELKELKPFNNNYESFKQYDYIEEKNKMQAKLALFGTSSKLNKLNKLDRRRKTNK